MYWRTCATPLADLIHFIPFDHRMHQRSVIIQGRILIWKSDVIAYNIMASIFTTQPKDFTHRRRASFMPQSRSWLTCGICEASSNAASNARDIQMQNGNFSVPRTNWLSGCWPSWQLRRTCLQEKKLAAKIQTQLQIRQLLQNNSGK